MHSAAPEKESLSDAYARIERAVVFLREHRGEQPDLGELAAFVGLSPSRTQRLFSRWAGISPKRFMQYLTVENAKQRMQRTADLLSLSLDAGLSGPGRLHDLFVNMEAMSPGEFKRAAAGLTIDWAVGDTPFGAALIATTPRGICHLSFVGPQGDGRPEQALLARWPQARVRETRAPGQALLDRIFGGDPADALRGLSVWVSGTNFQIQVWRALLRIPFGGVLGYRQLASLLGMPRSARPVGSAIARNPVAYLIPCHRVLRQSGEFGAYHWGGERKMAIHAWEAARRDIAG